MGEEGMALHHYKQRWSQDSSHTSDNDWDSATCTPVRPMSPLSDLEYSTRDAPSSPVLRSALSSTLRLHVESLHIHEYCFAFSQYDDARTPSPPGERLNLRHILVAQG